MRIAIVINTSWNIYNFRMNLVRALLAQGHEVVAIAPRDVYTQRLIEAGCRFVPVRMGKGSNPFADLLLIWKLYRIYSRLKPDVLLHFTIKPNIYGTLAAKMAGIPAINNVSGLGTVFIIKGFVSAVALLLYRVAFRYPRKVFFQNEDDRQLFLSRKLVKPALTDVLPGSGIDLQRFTPAGTFVRHQPFVFLMVARLLYEKGVAEYVEACRLLKKNFPEATCQLLGAIPEGRRSGISQSTLHKWQQTGVIDYLGTADDVAPVIGRADCVVLPSYREGTPRTLLEAAAMGKPLIATDVPGCREVVQHGKNGLLCCARSSTDLAEKMMQLMQLPDSQLEQMGQAGRQLTTEKFNDRFVTEKYIKAIAEVTNSTPATR
ncbi:glycosyltransferase family 4 protein [Botryobacter ruber]|uniref:glycosyltransferase family 4 protein n=1 Tax=Botryobacter ruber TaxID=2171629 RepID=UPI000E09F412|nr:glycosyltransferase family 4 protein [Botryobacter ruber]